MAITDELGYSTTAASNTTLGNSITLDGSVMTPSQVDDAFREEMSQRAKAISRHVTKAAGSYTPARADHNQFWRCTGAVTLNLTAAATLTTGWCLWVWANGGAVTIDPNSAELIDDVATVTLSDGMSCLIVCTGTAFYTWGLPIGLVPLTLQSNDPGAVGPTLELYHNSASPAVSDTPNLIKFSVNSSTGVKRTGGQISTFMTDPTNASEDVDMYFTTLAAGAPASPMHLSGANVVIDGGLMLGGALVAAGTWTPTVTLGTNAQASTPVVNNYLRIGSIVLCWGTISLDPTTASVTTTFNLSLPIASNFAAISDAAGTSASGQEVGRVAADSINDNVQIVYTAASTAAQTHSFMFSYKII